MVINPVTIANSLDKAELLNQQVFTNEPASSLLYKGPSPHPTVPEVSLTCQGIENLLNSLQTHKATGPDAISTTKLKTIIVTLLPSSRLLFRLL